MIIYRKFQDTIHIIASSIVGIKIRIALYFFI